MDVSVEQKFKSQNARKNSKIVLIDDDSTYRSIMESFAMVKNIELDHFPSLQEMGSIGKLSEYDLAIVDYDLGYMNGIEIAEYLPIFFGQMPMVLISGRHRKPPKGKNWPSSIRSFIHKDKGPDFILDSAKNLVQNRPRLGVFRTNKQWRNEL